MKSAYDIAGEKIIIDFEALYCDTAEKLLRSGLFSEMLGRYIDHLKKKKSIVLERIIPNCPEPLNQTLHTVLRLLSSHTHDEIESVNPDFARLIEIRDVLFEFVEGFYNYWRHFERYLLINAPEKTRLRTRLSIYTSQFINSNETLKQLILTTYRTICSHLTDDPFRVYRQLPAGADIGFMTQKIEWKIPCGYELLEEIPFIRLSLLEPPVIFYTKRNTRKGLFSEVHCNPLEQIEINPDDWFCYPAKIGELLAFAYFHKNYLSQGAALSNLMELAHFEDIYQKSPDIVFLFGGPDPKLNLESQTVFYQDMLSNVMLGYNVSSDDIDYFGYMKKMLLTLHNVNMINKGVLPVHGAMVSIRLISGKQANLLLIGDSGAGKSETLEAFRQIAREYISEMIIIFDDMGSLVMDQSKKRLIAYGTETGAFLRLDDLQSGYAFEQLDRSIFMNPHMTNARVIIPVTTYKTITEGTPVDFFLYCNNYEAITDSMPAFELFGSMKDAYAVFSSGKRMAMGTTAEKGLVESYFANPFGAPQRKEQHEKIAGDVFSFIYKNNIPAGQIRTQLGLEGMGQAGPEAAARALLDSLK